MNQNKELYDLIIEYTNIQDRNFSACIHFDKCLVNICYGNIYIYLRDRFIHVYPHKHDIHATSIDRFTNGLVIDQNIEHILRKTHDMIIESFHLELRAFTHTFYFEYYDTLYPN